MNRLDEIHEIIRQHRANDPLAALADDDTLPPEIEGKINQILQEQFENDPYVWLLEEHTLPALKAEMKDLLRQASMLRKNLVKLAKESRPLDKLTKLLVTADEVLVSARKALGEHQASGQAQERQFATKLESALQTRDRLTSGSKLQLLANTKNIRKQQLQYLQEYKTLQWRYAICEASFCESTNVAGRCRSLVRAWRQELKKGTERWNCDLRATASVILMLLT
jgi:hypothetical protein